MRAGDVALVLLAAGRSLRFGDADKLTQPFLHKPLACHVITALEEIPFAARIAVAGDTAFDFKALGYGVVSNGRSEDGIGHSIALGVAAARAAGAAAVLVVLADMPRVTALHVWRLIDHANGPAALVASSDGKHPMPPALFGSAHFDRLSALAGDHGARDLIRAGHHIVTSPTELVDIDTPEDLAALNRACGVA